MLAQVEQYKQREPLLQEYKQTEHPLLRAVRKLPPGSLTVRAQLGRAGGTQQAGSHALY